MATIAGLVRSIDSGDEVVAVNAAKPDSSTGPPDIAVELGVIDGIASGAAGVWGGGGVDVCVEQLSSSGYTSCLYN